MGATHIKQDLLVEIEKLPEYSLPEVLRFVRFLLAQNTEPLPEDGDQGRELDPEKDPLLHFIGAVSHGSLSKDIDSELYGA